MTETSTYSIVGAFHRKPADTILNNLSIGAELILRPEPWNQFDPNAIAIWLPKESFPPQNLDIEQAIEGKGLNVVEFYSQDEFQVGYIPRDVAAVIVKHFKSDVKGTFSVSPTGKPQVRFTKQGEI